MHTLKVVLAGFLVLGCCLLAGRLTSASMATAMKCFLVLWLIGTLINLWIGVSKAGYTARDEVPVAVVVFAVPAMVAALLWWRSS